MRRIILAAIVTASLATAALAQTHSHNEQGPHGGKIQDVVGVQAELLAAERALTIHLYDEAGKPVPATGYTASALVGSGGSRQVVQLAPGPENTMSGTAASATAAADSVSRLITQFPFF